MRNLIDMVPAGKRSASGTQHNGPCGICRGGDDRLIVWRDKGAFAHGTETFEPIGVYYCRQCSSKGDAIDYLRRADDLTFHEALAKLDILIPVADMAKVAAERQQVERGHAQQEALRLQRVRHEFINASEQERSDILHGDYARAQHDIETHYLGKNATHAFNAVCEVLTEDQLRRTGMARMVLREAIEALTMRARLAHLDPITAEGLV